jgi:Transcription initiation factor TFIIIB, Brf1 subunit/Transcription initiation factor TFIIB
MNTNKCRECGSMLINNDNKLVCTQCGLINYDQMILNEEKIDDDGNSLPSVPLGGKLLMNSYVFKDFQNKIPNENIQRYLYTMKKLDDKLKAFQATIKVNSEILNNLMQICSEIGFSRQLAINSLTLYIKSIKLFKSLALKFTQPTISAACLLITSRIYGGNKVMSLDEIVRVYRKIGHRVVKSNIAWCASIINKKLIDKPISYEYMLKTYLERYINFIQKESDLHKDYEENMNNKIPAKVVLNLIKKEAIDIISKLDPVKIQGKSPLVLAATILYLANKVVAERLYIRPLLSQKNVSKICEIPEFSIRDNLPFILALIKEKCHTK